MEGDSYLIIKCILSLDHGCAGTSMVDGSAHARNDCLRDTIQAPMVHVEETGGIAAVETVAECRLQAADVVGGRCSECTHDHARPARYLLGYSIA